jgi:hypothetical protein
MSDLRQRRRKLPWHVDTRHADLSDARQIRKPQADGRIEEDRPAEAWTYGLEGCQIGRVLVRCRQRSDEPVGRDPVVALPRKAELVPDLMGLGGSELAEGSAIPWIVLAFLKPFQCIPYRDVIVILEEVYMEWRIMTGTLRDWQAPTGEKPLRLPRIDDVTTTSPHDIYFIRVQRSPDCMWDGKLVIDFPFDVETLRLVQISKGYPVAGFDATPQVYESLFTLATAEIVNNSLNLLAHPTKSSIILCHALDSLVVLYVHVKEVLGATVRCHALFLNISK